MKSCGERWWSPCIYLAPQSSEWGRSYLSCCAHLITITLDTDTHCAPVPILLRSQAHCIGRTLRRRTGKPWSQGLALKGILILAPSLKDHRRAWPCMRMTYRPEQHFTFKEEKQTSSIPLLRNTYFLHCMSRRTETGNTCYMSHYCYCCCCCC